MSTKTQNQITPLAQGDSPSAFVKLITAGLSSIVEAAQMLKRLVDNNPNAIQEIKEIAPSISSCVLTKLLHVAEGHLMPELLLNGAPALRRLQLMPVTIQKAALKKGYVDMVTDIDSGETLRVPLADIDAKRVSQVFDATGPRSIDDQRAFLKRQMRPVSLASADDYPWLVKKDTLIVNRPCVLSKKDVLRILEELS